MDIVFKPTLRTSFRQYVELLQPMLRCTTKEADILAEFMYHNYLNRDIPERARNEFVFGTSTRKQIREQLNMSSGSFNNNMSSLRKRGILKQDALPKKLQVTPTNTPQGLKFNLNFHFLIQDAEEGKADN
jgi:DNA-binding MarR family transcriptional regulator